MALWSQVAVMTNDISQTTHMARLIDAENATLQQNSALLGEESLRHCQLIEDAFDFLFQTFEGLTADFVQVVLLQFIAGSKLQVATGFLQLLRGQYSDSRSNVRKAIENALFAINLFERPESAEKWAMSSRSNQTWKKYLDDFKIMRMLKIDTYKTLSPTECSLVEFLIDRYELCCLNIHATILSNGERLSLKSPDGSRTGTWTYLVDFYDEVKTPSRFWFDANTYLHILLAYEMCIRRAIPNFDKTGWEKLFDELTQNHTRLLELRFPEKPEKEDSKEIRGFWQSPKRSD
ncbi:MAG: hypothetical protein C0507_00605 [Cyanobacteria bacterium PR.3.49]|nr:hypothetical protein [Cyanobacteria bacterium PR.3.49]